MTPGAISPVAVADKIALVRRMLDGARSLPLDDLASHPERVARTE